MVGACFWVGQPLTSSQEKKDRGLKMAVDDGSVFFGGRPLTQGREKRIAGAVRQETAHDGVGNVAFNDSCINTNQLRTEMTPIHEIRQSQADCTDFTKFKTGPSVDFKLNLWTCIPSTWRSSEREWTYSLIAQADTQWYVDMG